MENDFPAISWQPVKPYMQIKCELKTDMRSLVCSPDPEAWETGMITGLLYGPAGYRIGCAGCDFQANRKSTQETKIFGEMDIVYRLSLTESFEPRPLLILSWRKSSSQYSMKAPVGGESPCRTGILPTLDWIRPIRP